MDVTNEVTQGAEPIDFLQIALWITTVLGAVSALWIFVWRMRRFYEGRVLPAWQKIEAAMIVLNGRPAVTLPEDRDTVVSPPIEGAAERLTKIEERCEHLNRETVMLHECLSLVQKEVSYNNGSSLKDAVRRIERSLSCSCTGSPSDGT